jgi:hypothetical protein
MKLTAPLLATLVLVGGVYLVRTRARANSERKFANTDEFVQWLASEAVKDAWEQNHVKLDYSVESIKYVERILGGLHSQYTKDPSTISVKGLGSAYGAYIGEVIRRSEPGAHWQRDDEMGEKSYPIIWGPTAGHSYPMAWCYHRILNGDEDNVWVKYRAIKDGFARRSAPPATR